MGYASERPLFPGRTLAATFGGVTPPLKLPFRFSIPSSATGSKAPYSFTLARSGGQHELRIPGTARGPDVKVPSDMSQQRWVNRELARWTTMVWDCTWRFHDEAALEGFLAFLVSVGGPEAPRKTAADLAHDELERAAVEERRRAASRPPKTDVPAPPRPASMHDFPITLVRLPSSFFAVLRKRRHLRRLVDVIRGTKDVACLEPPDDLRIERRELDIGFGYLTEALKARYRPDSRWRADALRYYLHDIAHPQAEAGYWRHEHAAFSLGMWARLADDAMRAGGEPALTTSRLAGLTYPGRGRTEVAVGDVLNLRELTRSRPVIQRWVAGAAHDPVLAQWVTWIGGEVALAMTRCLGGAIPQLPGPRQTLIMVQG